jgi:cyclic pyranopterin phosphate synthase
MKLLGGISESHMIDPFGRKIDYVRISVTDRCDLRCVYCMSQHMTFLPRKEVLTLDELDRLCSTFIRLGTNKIRITGGEPLVRSEIIYLFEGLGRHLNSGQLRELTLTTNGTQLARFADALRSAGVRRINVSLDSLDAAKFESITRRRKLDQVLLGLKASISRSSR